MAGTEIDTVTGAGVDLTFTVGMPQERLWDLITDVSRFGEWSPECTYAAWLDTDAPGPRPGARFEGRNDFADGITSSVICVVTEAVRPHAFAWVVLDDRADPDLPASIWRYELHPAGAPGLTRLRHRFVHGPGNTWVRKFGQGDHAVVAERLGQMGQNMAVAITAMTRCDNPNEETK